ncbi:NmrA family NAD(P)-binding protein, partial [Klebsiella pneumoniae]
MKTDNFNHAEKVLVLGAGQLGAAVLDALVPAVIERQGTVSVIVSPAAWDEAGQLRSSNHQALADAGATFLAVDIAGSAMETLADQFRGFTTVINCMGFVAGPGTQLKITRAVLAAGVPRYFPWQFGVNYDVVGKGSGQPVWDEQYDVRTLGGGGGGGGG